MGILKYIFLVLSSTFYVKSQYVDPNGPFQGYMNLQPIPQQQVQYAPAEMQQGIPYYAPYPYQNAVQQQNIQLQPQSQYGAPEPYSNVQTEIFDVDPEMFRQLMSKYKFQPKIVSYETRTSRVNPSYGYQPGGFIIKTDSNKSNKTSMPSNVGRHEVKQEVFSFNKTFVIHPEENKDHVLNLNFVNGVQVTDAPEESIAITGKDESYIGDAPETTVTPNSTATKDGKRFMEVPEGCEEGMGFSATGGCFAPFHLNVTRPSVNNLLQKNRSSMKNRTVASPRRHN